MALPATPTVGQSWTNWGTAVDMTARVALSKAAAHVLKDSGDTIAVARDGGVITRAASGPANDADVIQAALDYASSTPSGNYRGGAAVSLSADLFEINKTINLPHATFIQGVGTADDDKNANGMWGTVLEATTGFTGNAVIRAGVQASGSRVASNPHHALIQGIGINGMGRVQRCFESFDTRMVRLRNFTFRGAATAIYNYSSLPPDEGGLAHEYIDFFIDDCGGEGILHEGTGATDGMIAHGRILSSPYSIRLLGGGGWQLSDLHMTHSASNPEHIVLNTNKTFMTNCYLDSGSGPLMTVSATSWLNVGYGCLFQMTGAGTTFIRGGTKFQVSGASFEWSGSANPRSFVEVGAGANVIVSNNRGGPQGSNWVAPVTTLDGTPVESSGTVRYIAGNVLH